jgi:cobalt-zinc-cadmium efflux system membrane fusion protein
MNYITKSLTLLSILLLFSCKDGAVSETTVEKDDSIVLITAEQFNHAQMSIGQLESHNFNTSISLNGHLEVPPHNKATIATYYGGHISYSPYLIGDKVKKGQLLIKMKNPEFIELQENYIKAFETYQYLEIDFKRQEQLHQKSVIADQDFQKIQKDYKSALADVASLGAQLELLDVDLEDLKQGTISSEIAIHAPIDGVISMVELNLGAYIPAQSEMMEIVDDSDLHLELDAFEKDLDHLEKGQKIEFSVVGSTSSYFADLELIGSEVEEEDRTVTIHADLSESYSKLIPGLFVNAMVYANPQELDALPKEAFLNADDQTYVLVLEYKDDTSYRFRKRVVSINRSDESHRAFDSSDLKDAKFLISGGFQLF